MHRRFVQHHGPSPFQLLTESIHSLRLLGRRSLLALLGIVVGSASIIALLNIGRNAADESIRAFKDLGADTLIVSFPDSPQNKRLLPSSLDADALKEAVPAIAHVAPITIHSARVLLQVAPQSRPWRQRWRWRQAVLATISWITPYSW